MTNNGHPMTLAFLYPPKWSSYMPLSSIKFHGAKVISMRCNGANIACGEEGTGNVAIYRRKDITKKHYHRLG